jgi:DNA mismatch endonuclease (patch repair protein)
MADTLNPEQRRRCMQRVRTAGTNIERAIGVALHARGYRYRKNVRGLPGSPDLVFVSRRVAVFIDGDFWHGFRFPAWRAQLAPFWQEKIEGNRRRDARNFRVLRRRGWIVIRVWQHEVERDFARVMQRIVAQLSMSRTI